MYVGMAGAPVAAEEPPAAPTLPNFLGIPDGLNKVTDALRNRRGVRPQRERTPPLKRIVDAAPPGIDNPALEAAAAAKADADLSPQKIKAIKYLATVGCQCQKYREDVKNALLSALDDCDEEVRYEAAVALCKIAASTCPPCGKKDCCDADVMAKLTQVAEGRDAQDCWLEPSARVRAAAELALATCERVRGSRAPVVPDGELLEQPVTGASDDVTFLGNETAAGSNTTLTQPAGWAHVGDLPSETVDTGLRAPLPDEAIPSGDSVFGMASFQPPSLPPPQPERPIQPIGPELLAMGPGATFGREEWREGAYRELDVPSGPNEVTTQGETKVTNPVDPGELLQKSSGVQTAKVQRRSPVSMDPNIRGFKAGQVYSLADGVYWTPARRDLDTMLSKIDPGMIQNVIVIPGPYGLRYGPGFAFIDVLREPTPRYDCGFEAHFRTSGSVRTNGGQFYGRETVSGGSANWGFRLSYGHRQGSDYEAGNDLLIPSSYTNRDLWGEISYDLNPYQHIDFAYQRLDQTDTEYPGQFFDIGFLGTYGFELRVVDEDPEAAWSMLSLEGWYNRTNFHGNSDRKNNPSFPVMQRVQWSLDEYFNRDPLDPGPSAAALSANTRGAVASSGFRAAMTFGDPDETQLRLGTDFRYLGQVIEEDFTETPDFDPPDFSTNMPHSWLRDPGLYAEWSTPLLERWRLALGGRVDWIRTNARASELRPDTSLPGVDLNQEDVLYAFYLNNEFTLNRDWILRAGFGHAQRPPTLIERYADGLFLGIIQSGFTRVIGDPSLKPERNWQFDVGLSTDREYWRGHANFFHAWIEDYITLEDGVVTDFFDARLVRFTNTDHATLVGGEVAGELDLLPRLSAFGGVSYVDGRDRAISAALPAMPPLDTVLGLRLHDPEKGRRWGIELAARIVNDQDRLGIIRSGGRLTTIEERTPGFTVWHLRSYWNRTENLSLVGGIENLFDKTYQEHLDMRLLGPNGFPYGATRVLSPGFTPYVGVDWVF
jgi:iron complex outermembrane receptor protein